MSVRLALDGLESRLVPAPLLASGYGHHGRPHAGPHPLLGHVTADGVIEIRQGVFNHVPSTELVLVVDRRDPFNPPGLPRVLVLATFGAGQEAIAWARIGLHSRVQGYEMGSTVTDVYVKPL